MSLVRTRTMKVVKLRRSTGLRVAVIISLALTVVFFIKRSCLPIRGGSVRPKSATLKQKLVKLREILRSSENSSSVPSVSGKRTVFGSHHHLQTSDVAAVVTSISARMPQAVDELLRQGVRVYGTGDKRGPADGAWSAANDAVDRHTLLHFETASEQQRRCSVKAATAVCAFMRHMPSNHLSRKNIAYLRAIKQRPTYIWDFDDDNLAIKGLIGKLNVLLSNMQLHRFGLQNSQPNSRQSVLNPYPTLGPNGFIYPRGFPLESVADKSTYGGELVKMSPTAIERTSVFQAAANGNPDVDAMFRLTRNSRLHFDSIDVPFVIDNRVMAPYNAQATLHSADAFWALYLPVSVHSRVSDIWRSYIAQAIFRVVGLNIAFVGPLVTHNRNSHNLTLDLQNEWPLYAQVDSLVSALTLWCVERSNGGKTDTVEQLLVDVYRMLHHRKYLGIEDVSGIQLWIEALKNIGYQFPRNSFHQSTQVESPVRSRSLFSVFQAIHVSAPSAKQQQLIGPLRSLYAGIFPNFHFYLSRPKRTLQDRLAGLHALCESPFPDEITCIEDHFDTPTGKYGALSYDSFLRAVSKLTAAAKYEQAPRYLIWHHDDLLINVTTIDHICSLNATFAALPNATDQLGNDEAIGRPKLSIWEASNMVRLRKAITEHLPIFTKVGTVCRAMWVRIDTGMTTTDPGGDGPIARRIAAFAAALMQQRIQSDFIATAWRDETTFQHLLSLMLSYKMMVEFAVPVALWCSHSYLDIRTNFTGARLHLGTEWTGTRNSAVGALAFVNSGNYDLIHPVKMGLSLNHLAAALRFRDYTAT